MIIADDITGANETGLHFTRRGIPAIVSFNPVMLAESDRSLVLETDSRALDGSAAYEKLRELCNEIDFNAFRHVIKKVDSTLRGNIAWEVRAVDNAFGGDMVFLMPAFPDMGRTTKGAVQMIFGRRIIDTEFASDPRTPVVEDNLVKLLAAAYSDKVTHLTIRDIEAGRFDFSSGRLYVSDAVTNSHMQTVIHAVLQTGKSVLWVGTAAIADNLLEIEHPTLPAMALVASVSETTRKQVRYAEKNGVPLVVVPAHEPIGEDINRFIREAVAHLKLKKDVIVLTGAAYDRAELENSVVSGDSFDSSAAGERIQAIMGEIAADILKQTEISGIFLTGGDTAKAFFTQIGAHRFRILSEVLTAIPLAQIVGGFYDGLKVITKAGAFGKEDGLLFGLRKLKEKN